MEERDEKLWRTAKKRAGFQQSLIVYVVVMGLLWFIWWYTKGKEGNDNSLWPLWPMVGWGIGLIFQYMYAYGGSKSDLVQKEYDRLKNQEQGK